MLANKFCIINLPKSIDAQGVGRVRPPPAGEKCIGRVEKREKKERKWENQAKIGKIRLKIEEGKIEENHQLWLKIGTNC